MDINEISSGYGAVYWTVLWQILSRVFSHFLCPGWAKLPKIDFNKDAEPNLSSFVGSKSWLLFNKLVVPKSIEKCHELFVMLHFMN